MCIYNGYMYIRQSISPKKYSQSGNYNSLEAEICLVIVKLLEAIVADFSRYLPLGYYWGMLPKLPVHRKYGPPKIKAIYLIKW